MNEYSKCSLLTNKFYLLRENHNLSRYDLFLLFGIPISTLEKWEYGISSPPTYIYELLFFSLEYRKKLYNLEV